MTTSVDTNVIVALWDRDPAVSNAAQKALADAFRRGSPVLSAPVFAELIAAPGEQKLFSTRFVPTPASVLNLIWMKRFGVLPDGRSRHTHQEEGNNAIPDHAGSWPTS